jgi:hypothetical protein
MEGEFPIFPLIFMLTIIIALSTTFMAVVNISTDIGSTDAGVRAATVIELFRKADEANRFLETAILLSTRDAIADRYRTKRYPCEASGRFVIYDDSCRTQDLDETITIDELTDDLISIVQPHVNKQLATHPDAFLPSVTIEKRNLGGRIALRASSREEAVFFLTLADDQSSIDGLFSRADMPVHTAHIAARADVHELIDPFVMNYDSFDPAQVDQLIEEARQREDSTTYCPEDFFAPIAAVEYLSDLIEACPESSDPCTCGTFVIPPNTRDGARYTLSLRERSVVLSNVYDLVIEVSKQLNETNVALDDDEQEYALVSSENMISLIDPGDVDPVIARCTTSDPKVNMFSTFHPSFDFDHNYARDGSQVISSSIFEHERDPPSMYDLIRVKDHVAFYNYSEKYTSYPPDNQNDIDSLRSELSLRTVPIKVEGLNIILTTHEEGSSVLVSISEGLAGTAGLFDMLLGDEGLYPAREARLEVIMEGSDTIGVDQLVTICEDRIEPYAILSEPYQIVDVSDSRLGSQGGLFFEFFEPIFENGRFMVISIPSRFIDECGRERTLDQVRDQVDERLFRAAARAAILSSRTVPGELLCLNDPIKQVTHHPFVGYRVHDVYPYVIVPQPPSDFVWPLEDIGRITQCWGPPEASWTDAPYAFHRGIDLQPTGSRVDYGTVWDRFPDTPVVAIADGTIVLSNECPFSPYFVQNTPPPPESLEAAQTTCTGKDGIYSGGGFGEHLIIDHGEYYAIYAHLAPGSIHTFLGEEAGLTQPGSGDDMNRYGPEVVTVSAGQPIGIVGNTGTSTGAHLHFEVFSPSEPELYPVKPDTGYAPPAREFVQFSPFCILPQEVVRVDGSTYDISERMPSGGSYGLDARPTSAFEADEASASFIRPETLADQCAHNYLMAYLNTNTDPDNYGVCP